MIQQTLSFFRTNKKEISKYFFELILTARRACMTRHKNSIPLFNVNHDYFKSFFVPSTIIERNNLDFNTRDYESLTIFKKDILAFIRPSENGIFHC